MKAAQHITRIKRPVEWRPVPGYEGLYSVTRDGRVWSHGRIRYAHRQEGIRKMPQKPRWLKPIHMAWANPAVVLYHHDGHRREFKIRDLVRAAWGLTLPELNTDPNPTTERRPVPGYEGMYSITSDGRVLSHQRTAKGGSHYADRILRPKWLKPKIGIANRGSGKRDFRYPTVQLYHPSHSPNKYGHHTKTIPVHHLVMAAWGPPRPSPVHEINHIDSNKLNAAIENLEWVTRKENMAHSLVNGRRLAGLSNLTTADVLEIRRQYTEFIKSLTIQFGVSSSTISDIVKRYSWKYV